MCNQNCNQGRNCACGPRWVPKWHFWAALLGGTCVRGDCCHIDGTEGPRPVQVELEFIVKECNK